MVNFRLILGYCFALHLIFHFYLSSERAKGKFLKDTTWKKHVCWRTWSCRSKSSLTESLHLVLRKQNHLNGRSCSLSYCETETRVPELTSAWCNQVWVPWQASAKNFVLSCFLLVLVMTPVLSSEGTDCLTNELLKAFFLHNCKCLLEDSIGNLKWITRNWIATLICLGFFWWQSSVYSVWPSLSNS